MDNLSRNSEALLIVNHQAEAREIAGIIQNEFGDIGPDAASVMDDVEEIISRPERTSKDLVGVLALLVALLAWRTEIYRQVRAERETERRLQELKEIIQQEERLSREQREKLLRIMVKHLKDERPDADG